jgi:GT2 family glycosyltransferase
MNVAVVLVNWRNEKETIGCARAVKGWQTLAPQLSVIDNESTQTSRKVLAGELTADELIPSSENLGYGGGNNVGIKRALAAGAKYILLLNTDAEISGSAVRRMIKRLVANPGISILGPVIHEGRGGQTERLIGGRDIARYPFSRIVARSRDLRTIPGYPLHQVDYVSGTALLARSEAFEEIGMLDEQYFFSGEIADFCKRAKDKGHAICVDLEVDARHNIEETTSRLRQALHAYYDLRNRMLYVRKHHASQRLRYFSWWAMVGGCQIAKALLRGNLQKVRALLLALADGYVGRYGNQNARVVSTRELREDAA